MVSPRIAKQLRRARFGRDRQYDAHVSAFYADEAQRNSQEVMEMMDSMPPRWRKLARKHGLAIARAMLESLGADNHASAELALEQRKQNRQQEWLDTNYFIGRGARW